MVVRWAPLDFKFLCLAILIGTQGSCGLLNSEGLALLEFGARVEFDPYGAFVSWNPDDSTPCNWLGVHCLDGNVHMLNINGLSIHGSLAPNLGNLTHLRVLILSDNHFSGFIPNELGELPALELLDLRNNELSGMIPAELARIPSLKQLLLFGNEFERSIPVELEKFNALAELDENVTSGGSEITSANRKFGHCIWQSSLKQLGKIDSLSLGSPIKEFIQFFFSSLQHFKLGASASPFPKNTCCEYSPIESHPQIQAIESELIFLRRRLLQDSSSHNLAAAPAPSGHPPDRGSGSTTMHSSGAFPAVPHKNEKEPAAPVPSPIPEVAHSPSVHSSTDRGSLENIWKYVLIAIAAAVLFIVPAIIFCMCRSKAVKTVGPWKTGISGQLQKAFVTGVPKLNRSELETACEDFSNIINSYDGCTVYKGRLSSGVEIAVVSASVASAKDWSKRSETIFRKKVDTLSRVNHKNFVNLIGYCEEDDEPFTRMMVFEYAPNGTLSEHLHLQEIEHLDWNARMRIMMGSAYCLQYMHDLNPPVTVTHFRSEDIFLTDDYAAKIADTSFWANFIPSTKSGEDESENPSLPPIAGPSTNVYSFGVMLLEIISGKLLKSNDGSSVVDWASEYLQNRENISAMIDPSLKSCKDNELETICNVIQECLEQDPKKRPTMTEVITKLHQAIAITPDAATPRLSPLWWAELEILSVEAS
uniref:Receptor protein kinase CLAVATA1 n=1 Tax=Sedum alfredii TaxID=439688 RepID=A0A410N686_9MAGN|nr:receptor protein kinase CLAVATA1 [Sedum alfredii]